MLTNTLKALLVICGCALAELLTASILGGTSLPGLITFGFLIIAGSYEFARYVDRWADVRASINDLTEVIPMQDLKRLAPIADNPDLLAEFLQAYGVKSEATVSDLQQQLATLQATNNDLHKYVKQLQSDLTNRKSELERLVSELTLQVNSWKTKYEVLESGTDEQKAEHLRTLYFSAKNRLNAKK